MPSGPCSAATPRHSRRGRGVTRISDNPTLVLVLDSLFADLTAEAEVAREHGWNLRRWQGDREDLAEAGAALHVTTRVDAELIAALSNCRAVGRFGTGLDSVDLEAAAGAGVA